MFYHDRNDRLESGCEAGGAGNSGGGRSNNGLPVTHRYVID